MSNFKSAAKRKRELAKLDKRHAKDQKRALRKAERSGAAVDPTATTVQVVAKALVWISRFGPWKSHGVALMNSIHALGGEFRSRAGTLIICRGSTAVVLVPRLFANVALRVALVAVVSESTISKSSVNPA